MENRLTERQSKKNYLSFIWHGIFLSLASNFTDVHSIVPSMLIKAGANSILLGLLTAIMVGGSGLMQIVFASFISNKPSKKKPLLVGINLRIIALFLLGLLLGYSNSIDKNLFILLIFILISIFSFSGSYAAISYVDLVGKSIFKEKRKNFFSIKQTVSSVGILFSALLVRQLLVSYKDNYAILFTIASVLLFIASLGFWNLSEVVYDVKKKDGFLSYLKKIPAEIKKNRNLKNYLLMINTLAPAVGFIPFMILFAKKNFGLSGKTIGNILLLKVIGMLITSFILYKRSKTFKYNRLLIFSAVLGIILPILSLLFKDSVFLYQIIFVLVGVFISVFRIARSGILVEISNAQNRATYTGISGAGSIVPMLFPFVAGVLIKLIGYTSTFLLVSVLVGSSFFFIAKIDCKTENN